MNLYLLVENVNVKPSSKKVMRCLPSSSGDSRCATSVTNNNMSQTRLRRDGGQESGVRQGRRENSGERPVRREDGDQGRRHREKYPARREGERRGRSSPSSHLKTLLFGECSEEESNRSSIKRPISLEEYRERKKNRARAEAGESWPDLVFVEPSVSASQNLLERSDGKSEEEEYFSDEDDHFGDDFEEQRHKRARSHSSGSHERDSRRRRRNESSDELNVISISLPPPRPRGDRTHSLTAEAEVSVEDVSDYSEENEMLDLDQPVHLRTFLSHNSRLQEKQLAMEEQEELNTSLNNMIAHQAAAAVIECCLSRMFHVGPQKSRLS